tara:strand:- start:23265 stop:25295 length:2031 start_codon:yes stop_codon:yes gene_type:complete
MKIENIPNKNICFKKNILKGGASLEPPQQKPMLLDKCIEIIKNNNLYIIDNDVEKIKTYLSKNIKSLEVLYDIINLLTEDNKHYVIQYILYLSTSNHDGGTELNKVIKFIKSNNKKKKYFEIYNRHILNYYDVDKFYNLYNKKIINYTMMQTYDETPVDSTIKLSNNAKKIWNKKSIIEINQHYDDAKFENYLISEFYELCRNIITIKQRLVSDVPRAPGQERTPRTQAPLTPAAAAGHDRVYRGGPIIIIPSKFNGKKNLGKRGDFRWEIENPKQNLDQNENWFKTLYIFNDNHNQHKTADSGNGNADIRLYNKYGGNHPADKQRILSNYPASAGICTGGNGGGYDKLNQGVRKQIDSDVEEIREILNRIDTGGAAGGPGASGGPLYEYVKFSSDGNDGLGTSIFNVGPDVKDYILNKINELGTMSDKVTDIKRGDKQGTTANIYTGFYQGSTILIKIFTENNDEAQLKEAALQEKAHKYLQTAEAKGIFIEKLKKNISDNTKNWNGTIPDNYFSTKKGNVPNIYVPRIIKIGKWNDMNDKLGLPEDTSGKNPYIYFMEYIEEPTIAEDFKYKNDKKIKLYYKWAADRNKDNYLKIVLLALRDTLHTIPIAHNDYQQQNVMVKFNEEGNIDTITLIDFGQATETTDEQARDGEYDTFNTEQNWLNARRWYPDLYN